MPIIYKKLDNLKWVAGYEIIEGSRGNFANPAADSFYPLIDYYQSKVLYDLLSFGVNENNITIKKDVNDMFKRSFINISFDNEADEAEFIMKSLKHKG